MKYLAAAVQFEPVMFDKARNVEILASMVEKAAAAGARLIVTPEMGLTGYCWYDREEVAPYVEVVPGPSTNYFSDMAKRLDCYIVIGLPEVDEKNGLYYNTSVIVGPEGYVGKHRKTHPYIAEPKWAASGDLGHQVFNTSLGRISLLICMDIHFLETARLVALQKADVICHISNWLAERAPAPYWTSRARENGCYIIESNRWGHERTVQFSGGSCIIDPDGSVQASQDDCDGIVFGEIDTSNVVGPMVEQRRPELYHELLHNTYAWNPLDFFGLYGHNPLPKGKKSTVAVAQITPSNDMDINLSSCLGLIEKLADAELIVFPELALSGFNYPNRNAISRNHNYFVTLSRHAQKNMQHYLVGFSEDCNGDYYNSAALVGPEGVMVVYRKIHLSDNDREWATPGESWVTCDLPLGRLGFLIGHDANFPEAARVLALRGCDIIACPSALPGKFHSSHAGTRISQSDPIPTGADPYHWHHYRVRGGENNCYFVFSNAYSQEESMPGLSGIFGPDTFHFPRQEVIFSGAVGCVSMSVDTSNLKTCYPTNVVRRKDLVAMRLPHNYHSLLNI